MDTIFLNIAWVYSMVFSGIYLFLALNLVDSLVKTRRWGRPVPSVDLFSLVLWCYCVVSAFVVAFSNVNFVFLVLKMFHLCGFLILRPLLDQGLAVDCLVCVILVGFVVGLYGAAHFTNCLMQFYFRGFHLFGDILSWVLHSFGLDSENPVVYVGMQRGFLRMVNAHPVLDRVPRYNRGMVRIHRGGGNQRGPFGPHDPRHVVVPPHMLRPDRVQQFVDEAVDDRPQVADWYGENGHKIKNRFIPSDFPQNKCLFTTEEINNNVVTHNNVLFDPCGSPFCGLTAIDLAVHVKPDVGDYLKLTKYTNSPMSVGNNIFLRNYAFNRGVNLRMIIPQFNANGQIEVQNLDYMNNPSWLWVVLVVVDLEGGFLPHGADLAVVRHVNIAIDMSSSYSNLTVPVIYQTGYSTVIAAFVYGLVYSVIQAIVAWFILNYPYHLMAGWFFSGDEKSAMTEFLSLLNHCGLIGG
jgi:hypothetical protein